MSVWRVSVNRPVGTLTLAVAVVVFGVVSATRLAVDLLPSMDAPQLSITTLYPGVAPEEIETLITRPIEQAVSTIEGVVELNANSSEGLSRVQLRFQWGHDLEVATNDVREMLDRTRARLPEEADPPLIYKFDLAQAPVADIGLSGSGDPRRLRYLADEVISRRLERVPGVAAIQIRGGRVREIEVRLSSARLSALGISATEVNQAIARENRNVSAGDMLDAGREVVIRTEGEFESAEDIADLVIGVKDGRPIHVRDIGAVVDGFQDIEAEMWVDGEPGLRLRVSKQSGTNTVEVVEAVKREIEAINRDYDGRVVLTPLSDSSKFIEAAVTNVQSSALQGALLAVFVLLFFLRNVRATLVVATAIPISLLATFALMYVAEISLNVISLGGLALGVGMLVDGAIVILESSYRKMEEGLAPKAAAVEGSGQVALAVLAGALTTIAVFLPVVFIEGFAGVFFREMAIVVSFALAGSLVVALTVVPALCSLLLKAGTAPKGGVSKALFDGAGRALDRLEQGYARFLRAAVAHRWLTIGVSVLLLVASLFATPLVGVELMPETDEGEIDLDVELPVGTPIEVTMKTMQLLEQRVRDALEPGELLHITTVAGPEAFWQPVSANQGEIDVTLVPRSQRERSLDEVLAALRKAASGLPGAEVRARKGTANILFRLMRGGDDRLSVEVRGHDVETADRLAAKVEMVMREVPGVADVYVDREPGKVEQTLRLNRARLAELGLNGAAVAEAVETYVLGKVATRLRDAGAEYDVRVRLEEDDRRVVEQLASLPLPLPGGGTVPLGAVARVEQAASPSSIARLNQERVVRVNGSVADRSLDEVVADLREALHGIEVPDDFSLQLGGEQAKQAETFSGLVVGVLLALALVYAVLVVQFESLRQPFIIMTSVPFAFIGVVVALLASGTTFNLNSFLGVIVLVGIVVNNAILLVDAANLLRREEGLAIDDALVECGRRRLRPVLMTTATTVLGMLPLALGLGEGSEIQSPLARAVVGGLTVSTLVTLVFVPALYRIIEGRTRVAAPSERTPSSPAAAGSRENG